MKALKPSLSVLCKLGSLAVHVKEARDTARAGDAKALVFGMGAIDSILDDSEVKEWLAMMQRGALLPVKR